MNRFNFYNSDLDAFELYHLEAQDVSDVPKSHIEPSDRSNAVIAGLSGAIGTSIANIAVYPIDLITKRLQVQRAIRETSSTDGEKSDVANQDELYTDFVDAAKRIYKEEGGVGAFYSGALQDTANSMGTAFLYFLSYNYMRQRRLQVQTSPSGKIPKTLGVFEEISVGVLAGAFAKFFTAPIANVVTRKQTAALRARKASEPSSNPPDSKTPPVAIRKDVPDVKHIIQDIYTEKGVQGFWSGYDATLILTLNPAITFFLYETLKTLLPRRYRDKPTSGQAFLIGAVSKAVASAIMYPISLAKARSQVQQKSKGKKEGFALYKMLEEIYHSRGWVGLYEGVSGEILKGFFSNGITMLIKEILHRQILSLYFFLSKLRNRNNTLKEAVADLSNETYKNATTESQRETVNNVISASQEKLVNAKETVQSGASSAVEATQNALSSAKETVQSGASSAVQSTQNALLNAKDTVQNQASAAANTAQNVISSAKDTVQSQASAAASGAQNAYSQAKDAVQNTASSAASNAQTAYSGARDTVQNTTSSVAANAQSALLNTKDTVQTQASNAATTAQNTYEATKAKAEPLAAQASEKLSSTKDTVGSTISSAKDQTQSTLQNASEKVQTVLGDVGDKAANTTLNARRGLAKAISPDAETPSISKSSTQPVGDVSREVGGIEWNDGSIAKESKTTENVGDKIAGIEWNDKKEK